MPWSPKTKPTRANIVHRIEAAQAAIDGAMDLVKKADLTGRNDPLKPLDNAYQWLVEANRRARR